MSRLHCLKTWPEYFTAVLSGAKLFEVRWDDQNFAVGDLLRLEEWEPATERYTGRRLEAEVSYKLTAAEFPGLAAGFCVLGLAKVKMPLMVCGRCGRWLFNEEVEWEPVRQWRRTICKGGCPNG